MLGKCCVDPFIMTDIYKQESYDQKYDRGYSLCVLLMRPCAGPHTHHAELPSSLPQGPRRTPQMWFSCMLTSMLFFFFLLYLTESDACKLAVCLFLVMARQADASLNGWKTVLADRGLVATMRPVLKMPRIFRIQVAETRVQRAY